ncbi:MAG: hypothetical protein CFE31_03320 [Rhizobiales bacterium PAR1]|nr:MAG: hypothetical protein CFE31_03320 [Rhizobiales bacterium PAR1]
MMDATGPRSDNLLAILRRRLTLFLAIFAAVFGAAVMAYFVIPTRYVATAAIIVAQQDLGLDTAKAISADKVGDPADLESQLLLVRSPRILRLILNENAVKDALGRECRTRSSVLPSGGGRCEALFSDMDKLREQVAQRFNIAGAGRSRVININYESTLPDVAQTMANSLTMTFLADRRETLTSRREEAAGQLRAQMAQLESALRADEDRIQLFRRKNGLQRGTTAPIASERLTGTIQALSAAEAGKADASAKLNSLREGEDFADSPNTMARRTIGDIKQQIATMDAQIASESNMLGPLHPVLQSLERQRAALKRRLDTEVATLAASTKRRFAAAQKTASEINTSLGKLKNEAADANDNETKISALVRENDAKRGQIADLGRKIGDLEIQKRTISPGTELVNLAEMPVIPFFPKLVPFVAGGFLFGLLCAAGACLLLERRERARLGLDEVEEPAAITPPETSSAYAGMIGTIKPANHNSAPPEGHRIRRISGRKSEPFGKSESSGKPAGIRNPVIATFARLEKPHGTLPFFRTADLKGLLKKLRSDELTRTSLATLISALRRQASRRKLKTLLFTSATPGVGKTTLILSLAESLAAEGAQVLVIETDMKHPALRNALGLEASPGLAGVLSGRTAIQKALVRGAMPNLHILPAGSAADAIVPGGPPMTALLTWAQRFDFVLIDTPAEIAAPALPMLAAQVDGILCCAREADPVRDLHAMKARLEKANGRIIGLVQTMASPEAVRRSHEASWQGSAA